MMLWLFLGLLLTYTGMSIYIYRFWRKSSGQAYPIMREHAVLGIALFAHAYFVWGSMFSHNMIFMGFGTALNMTTWLMLLMYWAGSFYHRLQGLQLLLFPWAVVSLVLCFFLPGQHMGYGATNLPFLVHLLASILAYSLFGVSTLLAILVWKLEHDLHKRNISPLVQFLPPLLGLEKLMFQSIGIGFMLLTISVLSGTVFSEYVFGQSFIWSHKSIFGIISWLIYAALIVGRMRFAWRGRTVAKWVIAGFICLMLAYIGSKFVLEVVLGRVVS